MGLASDTMYKHEVVVPSVRVQVVVEVVKFPVKGVCEAAIKLESETCDMFELVYEKNLRNLAMIWVQNDLVSLAEYPRPNSGY